MLLELNHKLSLKSTYMKTNLVTLVVLPICTYIHTLAVQWSCHSWKHIWKSYFGMAARRAVALWWTDSMDIKDDLWVHSWVLGGTRGYTKWDLENVVPGGWLELGSSSKTTALRGRCDKGICHGAGSICFSIFSALSTEWHPSNASELQHKKQNSLFFLQLQTHGAEHPSCWKRNQHDLHWDCVGHNCCFEVMCWFAIHRNDVSYQDQMWRPKIFP